MNNLPCEARSPLANCWIFENRSYRYNDGVNHSLPTVPLEYEPALKELGTPYFIKGDYCEFWSPEHFEEEKVEAPLYARIGDVYRHIKSYTGTILSQESIKAAEEIKEAVDYEIKNMKLYQKVKSILPKGESTKAFYNAEGLKFSEPKKVDFNGESFLILPIKHLVPLYNNVWYLDGESAPMGFQKAYTGWNIVIDMNAIKPFSNLEIKVSKGKKGLFIGKGGWQVKEISKALMYRRISFVEEA